MKDAKEIFYFSAIETDEENQKLTPLDLSLNSIFSNEKFFKVRDNIISELTYQSNSPQRQEEDKEADEDDVERCKDIKTRKLSQISTSEVLYLDKNPMEENRNFNVANNSMDESLEMKMKNLAYKSLFEDKLVKIPGASIADGTNFNNHNTTDNKFLIDNNPENLKQDNNTLKSSIELLAKPSNLFKLPPIISPYSNFDSPEAKKNLENIEKDLVSDCTKLEILCYQQKNSFNQMFCCHNRIFQLCMKLSFSCKLLEQACQKLKKNFTDDSPESQKFLKSTECLESSCRQLELACRELKGSCIRVTSSNIDFSGSCTDNQTDFRDIRENLARKSAIMKGLEVQPSESTHQRYLGDVPDLSLDLAEELTLKNKKKNKIESKGVNSDCSGKSRPKKVKNNEKLKKEDITGEGVVRVLDLENVLNNEHLQLNQTEKYQILKAFAVFSKHCSEFIGKTDPVLCKSANCGCCGNFKEVSIKVCDMDNINDKLQQQREEICKRITQIEDKQPPKTQNCAEPKVLLAPCNTPRPVAERCPKNEVEPEGKNSKEKFDVRKQLAKECNEPKTNVDCGVGTENNEIKEKTDTLKKDIGKKHFDDDSCLSCKTLLDLCAVCVALQEQQMILCRKVTDMEKKIGDKRDFNCSKTVKPPKLSSARRYNQNCHNKNVNNNIENFSTNIWDKNSSEKTSRFPSIHNNINAVKSNLNYVKRYKSLKSTKTDHSNLNANFNNYSSENSNINNNSKYSENFFKKSDKKLKSASRCYRSPRGKSPDEALGEKLFYKNFFLEFQTIQQQQLKLCSMLNTLQKQLEKKPQSEEDMSNKEIINTLANSFHSLNFNLNRNISKEKLDFNNNSKSISTQTVSEKNEVKDPQKGIVDENISSKQSKTNEEEFVASQISLTAFQSEPYHTKLKKSSHKSGKQNTATTPTEPSNDNMKIDKDIPKKSENSKLGRETTILGNLVKDSVENYHNLNKHYFQLETPAKNKPNEENLTRKSDKHVRTEVISTGKIVSDVTQELVLNGESKENLNRNDSSDCKKLKCEMFNCPGLMERLQTLLTSLCEVSRTQEKNEEINDLENENHANESKDKKVKDRSNDSIKPDMERAKSKNVNEEAGEGLKANQENGVEQNMDENEKDELVNRGSFECIRNLADENCAIKLERMKDFYNSLVIGLGIHESNIYAADAQKRTLNYYGAENLMDYGRFQVPNMSQPWDIAIIKNFLFVSDCFTYSAVHRIDLQNNCIMKWICNSTGVRKLSKTRDDTLLVTKFPNKLVEYSLDGMILKELVVKADGLEVEHALKINNKTFVACGRNWLNPCKRIVAVDERGKIKKCYVQRPKFFKNCSSSIPHLHVKSGDILNKKSSRDCNNSNFNQNNSQHQEELDKNPQNYLNTLRKFFIENNSNTNSNENYGKLCWPANNQKGDENPYTKINLQCFSRSLALQSNKSFHQSVCFDDKNPCLDCKTIVEPVYMTMDRFGNILVCDYANNSIFLLDNNINFVKILLGTGSASDYSLKCCDSPPETNKCLNLKKDEVLTNKSQNAMKANNFSENSFYNELEEITAPAKNIIQRNMLKPDNIKQTSEKTIMKPTMVEQKQKPKEQTLLENLQNSTNMKEFKENIENYNNILNKSNNATCSDPGDIKCGRDKPKTTLYGEPLRDYYDKQFKFIPSKNFYLKVANPSVDKNAQKIEKPYRICLDEENQKIYICCCSFFDCNQIQTYRYS